MATTTNFGWETPDDTDLVKDGAAAMRTLGNSIDTSFVDLKGGTTNQVLAKNSNTDLDFKWVADATGIPATIIDAKGDLIAGTAADTAGRLAVGSNGQFLQADSGETTGLKWATVSSTKNFTLLNAGGTALTGAQTVTISSIGGYDDYYVFIDAMSAANVYSVCAIRLNGDTGSNYYGYGWYQENANTYSAANMTGASLGAATSFRIGAMSNSTSSLVYGYATIRGANTAGKKMITASGSGTPDSSTSHTTYDNAGYYDSSNLITSISIFSTSGNLDNGTVYIYGAS